MKTHRAWILAMTCVIAIALGPAAWSQTPTPAASPGFGTFSQGQPVIQQASYGACGACGGAGCGICGVTPTAGGFRLSNLAHRHGTKRASQCGCGTTSCGGSCGPVGGMLPAATGACTACGTACGGSCGIGSGLGSFALSPAGHIMGSMQAMNASQNGGYSTMMHGQENGPFGGGGCCTPIWYDLEIGWNYLQRKEGSSVGLTSRGIDGPIVLGTGDVDGEIAHGLRASFALLVGPSTALEATYFGAFGWDESSAVTGNADLFSVFSSFGLDQQNDGGNLVIGFPDTVDFADTHSLSYSSDLDSVELNLRRRWVSAGCLLHGSYLAGVRYVSLDEQLSHDTTVADGGFMNYDIDTSNEAVGFQLGGDMFVCISPRFKLGADLKGGIYGNDANVTSVVSTREVTPVVNGNPTIVDATPINEETGDSDVAFIGEVSATALFRVTPRLTIKGGYTLFYLDNMALAGENVNTAAPFNAVGRPATFNNKSETLYHGANLGITWMW